MDVVDAFTEEAINVFDTNVEGAEEEELERVIKQVFQSNEINWSDDIVKVCMLTFVAGRTYQAGETAPNTIDVPMDAETVGAFLQYLVQKGAT